MTRPLLFRLGAALSRAAPPPLADFFVPTHTITTTHRTRSRKTVRSHCCAASPPLCSPPWRSHPPSPPLCFHRTTRRCRHTTVDGHGCASLPPSALPCFLHPRSALLSVSPLHTPAQFGDEKHNPVLFAHARPSLVCGPFAASNRRVIPAHAAHSRGCLAHSDFLFSLFFTPA